MRAAKRIISTLGAALLALFMPGAIQDETTKSEERIPSTVVSMGPADEYLSGLCCAYRSFP